MRVVADAHGLRGADGVGERVDRYRTLQRLHALIHRLVPLDRQLVLLYLEGVDAAGIAEVTGLSPGNVATRISRLKTTLARRFDEAHPEVTRG